MMNLPQLLLWGSRNGAVVRALASHQCGPGSNSGVDAICGLSLLLVLSFAPRGFSPGTPVYLSPQKPTFPNSNSTRNQVDEEPLCGCATFKSLFIYLFIYSLIIPMGDLWPYREEMVSLRCPRFTIFLVMNRKNFCTKLRLISLSQEKRPRWRMYSSFWWLLWYLIVAGEVWRNC